MSLTESFTFYLACTTINGTPFWYVACMFCTFLVHLFDLLTSFHDALLAYNASMASAYPVSTIFTPGDPAFLGDDTGMFLAFLVALNELSTSINYTCMTITSKAFTGLHCTLVTIFCRAFDTGMFSA